MNKKNLCCYNYNSGRDTMSICLTNSDGHGIFIVSYYHPHSQALAEGIFGINTNPEQDILDIIKKASDNPSQQVVLDACESILFKKYNIDDFNIEVLNRRDDSTV